MSGQRPSTYVPLSIARGIRASARRTPGKVALAEGTRTLTYQELVDRINRVANVLVAKGVAHGDRVALMAPNCLEFIEIVCGISEIGAAAVMANPRLTDTELAYICNDSESRFLIVHESLKEVARDTELDTVEQVILIGDEYADLLSQARPAPPQANVEEWDVFCISYTAGTLGRPKGALLSHRSRALTFFGMATEYGCFSSDDRALAIAPLFHGGGFAFATAPIYFGGFCEIAHRFEPEQTLALMGEREITNTFMVPTHFNGIFALDAGVLARRKPPMLTTIISNAAPLSQAAKERIVAYFGEGVLHETYGSTEGGIVTNLRPPDQLRKQRCVGQAFPCTLVKLLDEEGNEVSVGEVGELFSHSPYLFNGYWKQPEVTQAALRDGWFSAGDLAVFDEERYVYLVDRKNDVIISGGVNIYPREIEEVLMAHPAVAEAAVVGVKDEYWGEAVVAFVSPRPHHEVVPADLLAFCSRTLARYKLPKQVRFLPALPRNAAGKVLRRELRALEDASR